MYSIMTMMAPIRITMGVGIARTPTILIMTLVLRGSWETMMIRSPRLPTSLFWPVLLLPEEGLVISEGFMFFWEWISMILQERFMGSKKSFVIFQQGLVISQPRSGAVVVVPRSRVTPSSAGVNVSTLSRSIVR